LRACAHADGKILAGRKMHATGDAEYAVSPDSPLDEVVATMAQHKYGCAVVMQNGKLVGIFTTVDVCRAFAEMLHGRLTK
jgi:CBS domain-containing protein